jgi:hypothetical protein
MKILFIDIDGVLNTTSTRNPRKLPYVAEKKFVVRLRKLLGACRAKTVLTSTWRYDPAGLFSAKFHGIPFIGCTPDLPHKARREEIRKWLRGHPRVTRFAVLDDEDDGLDELPLFQPDPRHGLTPEIARAIKAFLDGHTEHDMRRNMVERLASKVVNAVKGHPG